MLLLDYRMNKTIGPKSALKSKRGEP